MKNILIKITFILLSLSIYYEALSDSKTINGNLFTTTTTVINTAALTVTNCDGQVIRTIPATSNSYSKQSPIPSSGQTIRFMVYRKDPAGNTYLYQQDVSINSIGYSVSNGSYSYTLSNALLVNSRYNYLVRVYFSTDSYATYLEEQEFSISSASAIMPVGTVISYVGNSGNVSTLEGGGWFKCDGRAISTLTLNLTPDEITAFVNVVGSNLPDLRGVFLRGLDDATINVRDDDRTTRTGGEGTTGVRSYQGDQFGSHGHTGSTSNAGNHNHGGSTGDAGWSRSTDDGGTTGTAAENSGSHSHSISWDGNHSHTVTINDTGGAETRPENISVYYLIRGR
jgi:hypothetical protein